MNNYYKSVAILVGTMIGVGMFALPYIVSQSGVLLLFIYLPLFGLLEYYILRLYAEVILSTRKLHRTPGYAHKYLGTKAKKVSLVTSIFANYGSILAYMIIGGIFLNELVSPLLGGSVLIYTSVFAGLASFIVLFGLPLIARAELYLTGFLLVIIMFIVVKGWGYINYANYTVVDWSKFLLPYGPIFFAVGATSAMPEICRLMVKDKKRISSVIGWGITIAVLIMLQFVIVMVGITGSATTTDTLVGLNQVLGNGIVKVGLVLGVVSILTSYLITAQAMREIYWWDTGMSKFWAWVLACFVPFGLYLVGLQNLTSVVSLTGAFSGGISAIILIMIVLRMKKKWFKKYSVIRNFINKPIAVGLSVLFIIGLLYEVWSVLVK